MSYFPGRDSGSLEGFVDEVTGIDPNAPKPYKDHVTYICATDLGKRFDRSAVAVVEQQFTPRGQPHFYIKNLQRFMLGTTYTRVAHAIKKMDSQLSEYAARQGKARPHGSHG